jgi:hypothetical protein
LWGVAQFDRNQFCPDKKMHPTVKQASGRTGAGPCRLANISLRNLRTSSRAHWTKFKSLKRREVVTIDGQARATPLPHFWEAMFGSGRANLSLRAGYLNDLAAVKGTGMGYVRFHGLLDDENGVYTEDEQGRPQYNFSYVDHIYDGLLARGVRPMVEVSSASGAGRAASVASGRHAIPRDLHTCGDLSLYMRSS